MSFDPGNQNPAVMMSDLVWHRIFTSLVFDTFLKSVVRENYHLNPSHVTLQVTRDSALLYIKAETGKSILVEDEDLRVWAMDFIAEEVFSVEAEHVDTIYLDGVVGAQDAYLFISGKGIYITSGDPKRRGRYL